MPKQLQVGTDVKKLPLQVDAGFSSVKHHGVDVPLERLEVCHLIVSTIKTLLKMANTIIAHTIMAQLN